MKHPSHSYGIATNKQYISIHPEEDGYGGAINWVKEDGRYGLSHIRSLLFNRRTSVIKKPSK